LKVGFIGAGKVGIAFGKYLKEKKIEVIGYFDRNIENSINSSNFTKTKTFKNIKELVNCSDIIFITVNDDEIEEVSQNIIKTNLIINKKKFLHMSGAMSTKILKTLENSGANVYSLHPLQSFVEVSKAVEDLYKTYFSLEGNIKKDDEIIGLLNKLGNKYFIITQEQKAKYHMSACIFSNYLVTLMDFGTNILEDIGIQRDEGFEAMYPLIEGTLENIKKVGTKKALTGPIARGDIGTIVKHIESFQENENNNKEIYKFLGQKSLDLSNISEIKKDKILEILKND